MKRESCYTGRCGDCHECWAAWGEAMRAELPPIEGPYEFYEREFKKMKIERTEDIYSFASTKFLVTYPDGHVGTVWSPPWHELAPPEEEAAALEYAKGLYMKGEHKK